MARVLLLSYDKGSENPQVTKEMVAVCMQVSHWQV
jgi:hypothetical protein